MQSPYTKDKKESITIRLSTKEKIALKKKTGKYNQSISDFVRDIANCCINETEITLPQMAYATTLLQYALNYINETYSQDEKLEGVVDDLWKIMK